jgi:biopolymer transport protein ExbD
MIRQYFSNESNENFKENQFFQEKNHDLYDKEKINKNHTEGYLINSHNIKKKRFNNNACFSRKSSSQPVQINMIPLIDVLLILLIVFMITAETINSHVEINLPEAKSIDISKNIYEKKIENDLLIFIENSGNINFDNRRFIDFIEFKNFLDNSVFFNQANINHQKTIILSSDKKVEYQKIIEVLVALNNVGLNKIKMAYKNS